MPDAFKEDFKNVMSFHRKPVGTLGMDVVHSSIEESDCDLRVPHNCTRSTFDSTELDRLTQLFAVLYPLSTIRDIASTFSKYLVVEIQGNVYGSYKSRSRNLSIILAELGAETRPARINYFAKVASLVDGVHCNHVVVYLSWFKHHAQKNKCGKPVTIWEYDLFDEHGFIPIEHIVCRTVSLIDELDDLVGKVLFVSPYHGHTV